MAKSFGLLSFVADRLRTEPGIVQPHENEGGAGNHYDNEDRAPEA
jgi:hypothetical protein